MAGMGGTGSPEWLIREDASQPVLLALFLRQVLGIRSPDELPHLRGIPPRANDRSEDAQALIERQWREYWAMTVEPQAHPSPVPLDLVDGYETLLALPTEGAEALRGALVPHAPEALAFAQSAHARYRRDAGSGTAYRAYASAIAEHERQVGRRAPFVRAQRAGAAADPARCVVDRLAHSRRHRRSTGGCRRFRRRDPPDYRRTGVAAGGSQSSGCTEMWSTSTSRVRRDERRSKMSAMMPPSASPTAMHTSARKPKTWPCE